MALTFEDASTLKNANTPTHSDVQVEAAVQAVLDHIITTDRFVGYEPGELTPLDIASRVLAHLKKKD